MTNALLENRNWAFKDLTNQRFERLLVIKFEKTKNKKTYWTCKCNCGNAISVISNNLIRGATKSCGCLNKEEKSRRLMGIYREKTNSFKHGHLQSRKINGKIITKVSSTYRSWIGIKSMIARNKGEVRSDLLMTSNWDDFRKFLEDMGEKPPYTRLARYNKDDDYYKENCYWKAIGVKGKKAIVEGIRK